MVFSSHLFLFVFLPLALAVYYALPRRGRQAGLTVLSYGFYGWANPGFMVLMAGSTGVDYLCGLALTRGSPEPLAPELPRGRREKWLLGVSIVTNLSLLGFFKYFNFGVDSANALLTALGLEHLRLDTTLRVALPLGISFYTFQSMSYTFDVYRGRTAAVRSFTDFACFVSMFPQLVAGPIVRFNEIADQLRSRSHTLAKFARGVAFFSLGLAKKVLLANPCGKVADVVFDAGSAAAPEAWLGLLAYAFQIYFDFSGYSDMAIGLGLMLGFVLPKNFDSPYRAESVTDFWRRWHLSLSTWLRDYLYLPLGGNRRGPARTYVNLMLVMLLGGLWHGAAWNFVVWGGLHGVLLACERRNGKRALWSGLPRPLRVGATFSVVLVSWVFFRAPGLPEALGYLAGLTGLAATAPATELLPGIVLRPYYVGTLVLAAVVVWAAPQTWDWTRRLTLPRAVAVLGLLILALAVMETQGYNPFIYFIF